MSLFAAYNAYGDLVADGTSYLEVCASAIMAGYDYDEIMVVRVHA